jgi:60 kDa SS-A/Ro ribonucleoprotein
MRTNVAIPNTPAPKTHGGANAARITPIQQLRRLVLSCMLWEGEFYSDGKTIASQITEAVEAVLKTNNGPQKVADLAYEARTEGKLRHAPLHLVLALVRHGNKNTRLGEECRAVVADTLTRVIQRPDELAEFLSMYWNPKKVPLSNQVRKGLAAALKKFNEYSLRKYANREGAISLRDVLFLTHPRPENSEQAALWKSLANKELTAPDTWESELSAGKDKKETFARLIEEKKLGALALLRNLRNMQQSGVPDSLIRSALKEMNTERVLPFRFISAAKYAPQLEPELEFAMLKSLDSQEKLPGKTILIVDCSGSMHGIISGKSELDRLSAAAALAMLLREVSEEVKVYATAGNDGTRIHKTMLIPPRRGFVLRDLLDYNKTYRQIGGGGIFLKQVIEYVKTQEGTAERIIVITDEQDCDLVNKPTSAKPFGVFNYLMNVASAKNGIGYGEWIHVDGFSEAVVDFIQQFEKPEGGQES